MKKWLSILAAAGLLLYPFAASAADYGSKPTQNQQAPPVAQTLVREGDFAVMLAAELKLGNPSDETAAEDMLAKAGVAPQSGWISDYPMTPVIVGQLQDAIVAASAQGTLPVSSTEATKSLNSLAAQMNLPTPAGETPPPGTPPPVYQQNPNDVDQYYYDAGPPIVTYYPPPYYYSYLYDWVPYPTFWFGFWYPGFYICHNFTTVVVVNNYRHVDHFHRAVVSNHVIDPVTRRVAFVDPIVRTNTGAVRPMTTLRTENGERFKNVADMRRGASMTGFKSVTRGSDTTTMAKRGFNSPEARKSAQAIYSRSMANMRKSRTRQGNGNVGSERRYTAPSSPGRQFNTPSRDGERRSYAPERMIRSSAMRPYPMTPSMRQGGEPARNFARSNVPSYSFGQQAGSPNSARSFRGSSSWHSNSSGFRSYGAR